MGAATTTPAWLGTDLANRLLLRLWLAPRNSRPLPPGFEVLWGTTAPGAPRGGIAQRAPSPQGGHQ